MKRVVGNQNAILKMLLSNTALAEHSAAAEGLRAGPYLQKPAGRLEALCRLSALAVQSTVCLTRPPAIPVLLSRMSRTDLSVHRT